MGRVFHYPTIIPVIVPTVIPQLALSRELSIANCALLDLNCFWKKEEKKKKNTHWNYKCDRHCKLGKKY